jgi:hypothetical protein
MFQPNRMDRMHRSSTPLRFVRPGQASGFSKALKVSGTVTVLCLAGLVRPGGIAAQSTGTMRVVANVTGADAAWAGLSAAQQVARELAATPTAGGARRVDLSLTHIRIEVPVRTRASDPVQPAISIQYLRN